MVGITLTIPAKHGAFANDVFGEYPHKIPLGLPEESYRIPEETEAVAYQHSDNGPVGTLTTLRKSGGEALQGTLFDVSLRRVFRKRRDDGCQYR